MNYSSLKLILKKVKTWGLIGVWNFFKGKVDGYLLSKYFERNMKKHPYVEPERGITLIGNFYSSNSIGKVWRDFVFALKKAGIPYQTYNLGKKNNSSSDKFEKVLTPKKEFRLGRYSLILQDFAQAPIPITSKCHVAHWAFWEFDTGMLEFFHYMRNIGSVIAMSDYNYKYFKMVFPKETKVSKLLYPFKPNSSLSEIEDLSVTRTRYGIGNDDFAVFFNFDYNSSYFRKNPDGAMRAFAAAFKDKPDTKLVFKTNHTATHKKEADALKTLAKELGIAERFITIDSYLSMSEVYSITNACDIYLSLHRGEGFGLGIAEAMSLGKAVVVTDYSATTEFCNKETAFLVPYTIVPITEKQIDHPCYTYVTSCAEPDIDAAAEILSRCYEDRELCKQIGDNAEKFIQDYFSLDNFRSSVNNFLGK